MDACFSSRNWLLFKMSLLGTLLSLVLALAGIVPPFNGMMVSFPLAWLLSLALLLPSVVVYFNVKDGFWAEVEAWKSKGRKDSSA